MSEVLWERCPLPPLSSHIQETMLILPQVGQILSAWRGAREGVDSRRENWAGARTAELVPSLPGAAGIMRSGSWFRVSLEGSAFWVKLPQTSKGGQCCRHTKCPTRLCQAILGIPRKEEPGSCKDGPGPGAEGQIMSQRQGKGWGWGARTQVQLLTSGFQE